jgi:hypothetical protein
MKLHGKKVGNTHNANRIELDDGEVLWVPQSVCHEIRYNFKTLELTLSVEDWWWVKYLHEKERLEDLHVAQRVDSSNFKIDL